MPVEEALGPGTSFVVAIPVKSGDKAQTLRRCQSETVNVGDECKHGDERLTTARQSEFVCLLGGIDHVAAGICQCDDFRARGLRLQQIRTEIRTVEGMAHAPQYFSAAR